MTRSAAISLAVALLVLAVAPARADGPPIVGQDAHFDGITARGLATRYVALGVPGGTAILAIERRGGRIASSRMTPGALIVPVVAYDGSATGLSADGTTLVLAVPRTPFQDRHSRFAVFDAQHLRMRYTIALRGDFALDAISPDGSRLYFVQFLTATRYAVRAYDTERRQLLRKRVVDPDEPGEPVRGYPNARTLSRDGRWAYTLYGDGGVTPFIHALDTVAGRAKCIDLPQLAGRPDQIELRLRVTRDGTVVVHKGGEVVARVGRAAAAESGGSSVPAAIGGASVIALLAAAAVRAGRRGRPREPRP